MTKKNVFYYIMWVMYGTENKDFHRYKLLKTRGGECGVKIMKKYYTVRATAKESRGSHVWKIWNMTTLATAIIFFPRFPFSSSNYRRKYGLTVRAYV